MLDDVVRQLQDEVWRITALQADEIAQIKARVAKLEEGSAKGKPKHRRMK